MLTASCINKYISCYGVHIQERWWLKEGLIVVYHFPLFHAACLWAWKLSSRPLGLVLPSLLRRVLHTVQVGRTPVMRHLMNVCTTAFNERRSRMHTKKIQWLLTRRHLSNRSCGQFSGSKTLVGMGREVFHRYLLQLGHH